MVVCFVGRFIDTFTFAGVIFVKMLRKTAYTDQNINEQYTISLSTSRRLISKRLAMQLELTSRSQNKVGNTTTKQ